MKKINISINEQEAQDLLESLAKIQDNKLTKTIANISSQFKKAQRKEIEYTALYLYDLQEQELFDLWIKADAYLYLCSDIDGDLFVCDVEPKSVDQDEYLVPDELENSYSFGYIHCDGSGHYIDLDHAYSLNSIEMPSISTEDLREMLHLFEHLDNFQISGMPE